MKKVIFTGLFVLSTVCSSFAAEVNLFTSRHYSSDVELYKKFTNNTGATLQLYRNSGNIFQFALTGGANNSTNTSTYAQTTNYLDSPATTSSTSYTVYFGSQQNTWC